MIVETLHCFEPNTIIGVNAGFFASEKLAEKVVRSKNRLVEYSAIFRQLASHKSPVEVDLLRYCEALESVSEIAIELHESSIKHARFVAELTDPTLDLHRQDIPKEMSDYGNCIGVIATEKDYADLHQRNCNEAEKGNNKENSKKLSNFLKFSDMRNSSEKIAGALEIMIRDLNKNIRIMKSLTSTRGLV